MKQNNHGFTLAELLAVLVVLALLITIAATNVFPMIAKSKKKAFINDATILSEAATTKYLDDKLLGEYKDDVLNGKYSGIKCYNIKGLIGKYAKTDNKMLTGSVAVCTKDSCTIPGQSSTFKKTIIWLKGDRYKIGGKQYSTLTTGSMNSIINEGSNFDSVYMSCGAPNEVDTSTEFNFAYTGSEQTFTAPKTGVYNVHVWGAQGGHRPNAGRGYGGYATGKVRLLEGQILYINVGGQGAQYSGGYNGGGSGRYYNGTWGYGGGGATSISFRSGTVAELENDKDAILIVAGGGGGNSGSITSPYTGNGYGGNGGGSQGTTGYDEKEGNSSKCVGIKALQTAGGATYNCSGTVVYPGGTFGKGASAYLDPNYQRGGAGGGGGYYGGGGSIGGTAGAGGGSGYIGSTALYTKEMDCIGCASDSSRASKTVVLSADKVSETPIEKNAKIGNGAVKITYASSWGQQNRILYKNGYSYEFLGTRATGTTITEPTFGNSSITLPTTNYSVIYSAPIDLSTFNTLIIRKNTAPVTGRVGLRLYPDRVNNSEYTYTNTLVHIADDIYALDISTIDRSDLRIFIDQYHGANSGDIFFIGISTKTMAELQADHSFVTA